MFSARELGEAGERAALNHYLAQKYKLVEKNWRIRQGEIDLIFQKKDLLVFVEVKTKSDFTYGDPIENITDKKRRKLLLLVELYLAYQTLSQKIKRIRVDAAQVFDSSEDFRVRVVENILEL
jgi:putative endonuclease